jgi:hypothetical protein
MICHTDSEIYYRIKTKSCSLLSELNRPERDRFFFSAPFFLYHLVILKPVSYKRGPVSLRIYISLKAV